MVEKRVNISQKGFVALFPGYFFLCLWTRDCGVLPAGPGGVL